MEKPRIVMDFESAEALQREFDSHLAKGGAFTASQQPVAEGCDCQLVLVHPAGGAELELPARVVFKAAAPESRIGVAIDDFTPELRDRIRSFIAPPAPAAEPSPRGRGATRKPAHERVRNLSVAAAVKVAREGELSERVALERIYGKAVWESLLRNPRVTPPEVARIARKGTVPPALLELIAANGAWLSGGQVRRALLSNSKLGRDLVEKVLRAMPKGELRLVPKQTAYAMTVRQLAKRMLDR